MLTEFVKAPVRGPEVEPTMTVHTLLQLGNALDFGSEQLVTRSLDVIDPESGNRARVEMAVLHRVGAENLEKVAVGSRKTGETRHFSGDLHSKNVGEEPGGLPEVLGSRTDPNDASDLQDFSSVDDDCCPG